MAQKKTTLDYSIERKNAFLLTVKTIFHAGIKHNETFNTILDSITAEVYGKYARLPVWAKKEISGYIQSQFDCITQYMCEFHYQMPNGEWIKMGDYSKYTPQQVSTLAVKGGSLWHNGKPYNVSFMTGKTDADYGL